MSKTIRFIGEQQVGAYLMPRLLDAGFHRDDSADADITLTYCLSLSTLEDAFFENGGLIQSAKKESYLVDLSASTPNFARELHAIATVSDLKVIEAPLVVKDITRSDALSDKSNLTCFVAGDEADINALEDLFTTLVGSFEFAGEAGSAQLMRCAATLKTIAMLTSLIEADALYRAMKPYQMAFSRDLVKRGFEAEGKTDGREATLLDMIEKKQFSGEYTVHMCAAEITAVLMAADDVELILPASEAILQLLELLIIIGGSNMNPAALSLVYGDEAACAEQGLDWTRVEQEFDQPAYDDEDEGYEDNFPRGFDAFSSN